MLPSEFIFEKKIYYMSEMSAFKNFIMIEDEKVVQYLRSTFYYLLFLTAKMQNQKLLSTLSPIPVNFFVNLSFYLFYDSKKLRNLIGKITR